MPKHLVDDIKAIGSEVFSDIIDTEMATLVYEDGINRERERAKITDASEYDDVEDEAVNAERAKIVDLLTNLAKPSLDNPYVERKKAEFTVAVLRNMGLPVDCSFDLLRLGVPPETIANMMLEEREEESGGLGYWKKARIIRLLRTILTTPVVDDGFEHGKAIVELEGMGYPKESFYTDLSLGTPLDDIAERLIRTLEDEDPGFDV